LWVAFLVVVLGACASRRGPVHSELAAAADRDDSLALSDAVEVLIAQGRDTPAERTFAYEVVRDDTTDTAAAYFARAAVTGRFIQMRGLRAAALVKQVERDARRSLELDPTFRDGAAARMLGTLYVTAPATLLESGNSEEGLELLQDQVAQHPEIVENHLRLAEGYITLGDPAPACPHLRRAMAQKSELRPDDQILLEQLVLTAGPLPCEGAPATARDN